MQNIFRKMYEELASNQLEVGLIPADDKKHYSHCVRAVFQQNPQWYQELCKRYEANRKKPRRSWKHDTRIKRRHILNILQRLANGESGFSRYEEPLREYAKIYQ